MLHALVVEDDDCHAGLVEDALRGLAHVQRVSHADEALAVLAWVVPDLVLMDLRGSCTAHTSWVDHVASMRLALDAAGARARVRRPIPLILASGMDPRTIEEIAGAIPHTHALPKPFTRLDLRALVARITGDIP